MALREGQVGSHDHGSFFGSFGDDLEEQFGGHLSQGDIAQFIDNDQFHAGPPFQHARETLVALGFDELVDECRRGGEANSFPLAACGDGQARCEMGFPSAGFTDQKYWLGALEIAAFGQGADARCRDVRRLREIELLQRLHPRQMCILKAQFDGAPFTILDLALEQSFQVVKMRVVLLARFLSQRRELPADGK